jgi:hypothetical protein
LKPFDGLVLVVVGGGDSIDGLVLLVVVGGDCIDV